MSEATALFSWYVTYIWRDQRGQLQESYFIAPLALDLDDANGLHQLLQDLTQEKGCPVLIRSWKRLKGTLSLI